LTDSEIKFETKIVDKAAPLTGWVVVEETISQEEDMSAVATEMETATEVDVIVDIVSSVETCLPDQVFDKVRCLLDAVDAHYFEAGGYLDRIAKEGLWNKGIYDSFREAVEQETGIHYRKAMYLMNIYNSIVEAEIPWSKISCISWSKLKEVADILTLENVDEWVAKIMGPPEMTVLQVQEAVKAVKLGSLASSEIPEETSSITSISFKVHADQKENIKLAVDKAKGEAETEFDGVALDAICMNYLSGGTAVKPKSLSELLKGYEPEEVLEAFAVRWPEIDVTATM